MTSESPQTRKAGIAVSAIALVSMAAMSAYGFFAIPQGDMIARHWGLDGEPDGWSPRNHVLIGLPLLALFLSLFFAVAPAIDPRGGNIRRSGGLYRASWIGVMAILTLGHGFIVFNAFAPGALDLRVLLYAACAMIAVIGNFTAKSRSNWFFGIRTPWSLSSESAWIASNRAAGWLFVLTGLAAAASAAFIDVRHGFVVLLAGVFTAALAGVFVSYFTWKNDPERHSAARDS